MRAFADKLVGRDEVLGALVRATCASRLVTLHGGAGVGKTTLVRAAAQRLAEAGAFPAGVFWVSLRGVTRARAVQEVLAQHVPTGSESALFILDGLETSLAPGLLERFPSLHLLVTARTALGLPQEHTLELPPLSFSDARRLLVGWTRTELDPDESASLARLLDGNPQTVRLTAALLETEPLSALRVRLETQLTALTLHGGGTTPLILTRDLLLDRLPEGVGRLLGVLSLFATGAQAEDLEVSWGKGWQRSMDVLLRSGLATEEEDRYQVAVDLPQPPQAALGPTGVLLALALSHLRNHQTDPAFDLAERGLSVARTAQNREGFACALLVLGRITLVEDPARAALLLEEAATHFGNLNDSQNQGTARHWQGAAFSHIDEPEAALGALYEAQKTCRVSALAGLFEEIQTKLTGHGGGSLLAALELDAAGVREHGLLAARLKLGLPAK
ncbi:MAG: NACHT domain-containing protein [Armatimonadetes bacterium]|nr:NACHT domain-containing protein [Armatimonadota bacterium]